MRFHPGGHFGKDGKIILSPRICELSAYADPKPTPAPNVIADSRVVRPLNIRMAVANPVMEPYTNRRSVKSMQKSYFSSTCDCGGPRFFAISLAMSLKLFGPLFGAVHSSAETLNTGIISRLLRDSSFQLYKTQNTISRQSTSLLF